MNSQLIKKSKLWIVALCTLVFAVSSFTAFARGGYGGWHGGWGRGYWGPGWFGLGIASAVVAGAVIESFPGPYTTIVTGGVPYYYFAGAYYQSVPGGYAVVPTPVTVAPGPLPVTVNVASVQENTNEAVVINVPNAHGGYTPVQLTKHNNGYIGPQGEYYECPTVKQLKVLYGE